MSKSNSHTLLQEVRFTQSAVLSLSKHHSLLGRRLILVDIENVVEGAVLSEEAARWARVLVEGAIALRADEQVVVATSHIGLLHTHSAWRSARLRVRSGCDGADLELLRVLETERISDRFDEVVLVSGDGIFTDEVARLGGLGVRVTVVAWSHCLAARLRMAASRVLLFDAPAHLVSILEVA
ncbi:MAG: NYN domain-containing protein [Solirubrobacteraceae bacterium]